MPAYCVNYENVWQDTHLFKFYCVSSGFSLGSVFQEFLALEFSKSPRAKIKGP